MFKVMDWRCRQESDVTAGTLDLWFQFGIKGPANSRHLGRLDIIWPSGNTQTLSQGMLPFDEFGGIVLEGSATLTNIVSGECKFRIFVAGKDLGEFPFTIE
jgi:hypothetical protein